MVSLSKLLSDAREIVGALDESALPGGVAIQLVEDFAELERLAFTGRALAAARVAETRVWRSTGATSAAAFVASRTGTTTGQAASALRTVADVARVPEVREALIAGELSREQAAAISGAAVIDPAAAQGLLSLAQHESLETLREHCADVVAAASGDEDANERAHRRRYLRYRNDEQGAVRMEALFAPDDSAGLLAVVSARAEKMRAEAIRSASEHSHGGVEPLHAYMADALLSLVDGAGAPDAVVNVFVSSDALQRGHTVAGETCRIDGVGPISVAAAQRFASRGIVKVLETDGIDVRRVAHAGRTIPAHVRSALEARDPRCVVPDCSRRTGLEIDHIVPFAEGGPTALSNLARLCRWHHAQKTHHGWMLGGQPGAWTWTRHAHAETPRTRGGSGVAKSGP